MIPRWRFLLVILISGGCQLFSFRIHQVQAWTVPEETAPVSSRKRGMMATITDHDEIAAMQYRLLQKDSDQEIVWKILMNAAHERDLEEVKSNSLLQPYAQSFGSRKGDIGVVATAESPSDNSEDSSTQRVAGAAWVRLLPEHGFATSVLDDPAAVHHMPELAIACLPEYRGQGIGSRLLRELLRAVKEEGSSDYPGVCLSCREGNPAMRLYERMGFSVVPGSTTTNRTGGTSVTMKIIFDEDGKGG